MKIMELMIQDVKAVGPDTTVGEAVEMIAEYHISALPVTDQHDKLIGVVSTTDILEALAEHPEAREDLMDGTPVRNIMTPRPLTIPLDADLKDAAQQMLYFEVHRLFVEDQGKLVGVLSQSDIVRAVATAKA